MLGYVDHVTLAVKDLEAAIDQFRDGLSFVVSKPRCDPASGLANAVIPLLQGYLELISVADGKKAAVQPAVRKVTSFLHAREGLYDFAIQTSSLEQDVAALRSRGSKLEAPDLERWEQDGKSTSWWTSLPPPGREPAEPFLIERAGPPDARGRQAALSQPFAIRSIDEVTVIVGDLDEAILSYERDFGLKPSRRLGGRAQIWLLGSKINIVPSAMTPLGTPLGLHSVGLGTTDITGARSQLRARDISYHDPPLCWAVGSQIDPRSTAGSRIYLVQS